LSSIADPPRVKRRIEARSTPATGSVALEPVGLATRRAGDPLQLGFGESIELEK